MDYIVKLVHARDINPTIGIASVNVMGTLQDMGAPPPSWARFAVESRITKAITELDAAAGHEGKHHNLFFAWLQPQHLEQRFPRMMDPVLSMNPDLCGVYLYRFKNRESEVRATETIHTLDARAISKELASWIMHPDLAWSYEVGTMPTL